MVTSSAPSHHAAGDVSYSSYLREANAQEAQAANYGWMEPIVIEDDLMFGGKSLSTWYEEERRSLHAPAEEERRGRQRVRQQYSHPHHHHHHHHHHHGKSSKSSKSSGESKH
jgi:hypothetical protein